MSAYHANMADGSVATNIWVMLLSITAILCNVTDAHIFISHTYFGRTKSATQKNDDFDEHAHILDSTL